MPVSMKTLLEQYTKILQKIYGKHLKSVILYGSYARGDYREDSDIDIWRITEKMMLQLPEKYLLGEVLPAPKGFTEYGIIAYFRQYPTTRLRPLCKRNRKRNLTTKTWLTDPRAENAPRHLFPDPGKRWKQRKAEAGTGQADRQSDGKHFISGALTARRKRFTHSKIFCAGSDRQRHQKPSVPANRGQSLCGNRGKFCGILRPQEPRVS